MGNHVIVPATIPATTNVPAENLARYGMNLLATVGDDAPTGLAAKGGGVSMVTGTTDNDEIYVGRDDKPFVLTAGEQVRATAVFTPTEGNTDDMNFIFGLSSLFAANLLVDNGAGPAASYDGVVIFKVDGGTVFQAEYSDATTQVTETSIHAWATATEYTVEILVDCGTSVSNADITITINNTVAQSWSGVDLSGLAAAMTVVIGVKAGGANAETVTVPLLSASQG